MPQNGIPGFTVVDLFSGAGGMSYGFHAHDSFRILGAIDGEIGKPSDKAGSLECNVTYELNMGVRPKFADIASLDGPKICEMLEVDPGGVDVLIACSPCTGLSRANPNNHIYDDPRNSLIVHVAHLVEYLKPRVLVMENAREMLVGNFSHHFTQLRERLESLEYEVHASVHMLSEFGLPQQRERALVIAVAKGESLHTLEDLWSGFQVSPESITVRRAIADLPPISAGEQHEIDEHHTAPSMKELNTSRLKAIPRDGGSWIDLLKTPGGSDLLTPAMTRNVEQGNFGSYPDIYGRMAWDKPAPTIKRECAHVGNGRYAHPEQDRLCSVRELALLSGFPRTYRFGGRSISNHYRHIGDAVPPLISYQIAHVVAWILSGKPTTITEAVLAETTLRVENLVPIETPKQLLLG